MKRILTVLFLFAFLTVSLAIPKASPAPARPELRANYTSNAPTIDGYLGTEEWKDASRYWINLTDPTDANITTWLYIKHNDTHMQVGLVVWQIFTHSFDEFALAFDEGDDGARGSGARDYILTSGQEDRKSCFTPQMPPDHDLSDGYFDSPGFPILYTEIDFNAKCIHETDHGTNPSEIEYFEGMSSVDDHWEAEFSIPFVGNDEGVSDLSDLNCTSRDTVGLKIEYIHTTPLDNYFYPAGDPASALTYADVIFLPPAMIESCDVSGTQKDAFALLESIYVTGAYFVPSTTYDIYVVLDVTTWINGSSIPARTPGTAINVTSGPTGSVPPTEIWNDPPDTGLYDIVLDVNRNGIYDEGIDVLDTDDIQVTAGFVVPEFLASLTLLAFMTVTFFACWTARKKIRANGKPA